uniref:NADH:ubiquinone reductase (H(+)-translocating) n=1 Tax=Rhinebothrium taeniuri TaxID=2810038 RepID=A0A8K1W634_9CEST|nr:NADH dehydrogenase subunit 5 [Rhinebothrium taeniuri]
MLFFFTVIGLLIIGSLLCMNHAGSIAFATLGGLNGLVWEPLLWADNVSYFVLLMLSICYGYAYFYNIHYFSGSSQGEDLSKIVFLFVSVMATLVLTGDFLGTLILWEYLGVVSFFLILFYSNYLSLRSSVVTLVSSRFGDVCLFIIIAVSGYLLQDSLVATMLFFFVVITKSAGFPFVSWLLEAMRAPTPVSSLVHSSTLVAAGVWFSMRYDISFYTGDVSILVISLCVTILLTGVCCFFFLDLKKIVALSTCNNISWCILYLLFGDVCLSLFQLVSHGVSKCLLFMLVGDVMSGSSGSQASNAVYMPRFYGNWGLFGLFSVVLGLSGAPFVGVFFTKHFLLSEFGHSVNICLWGFIIFCVFISYFYSFRLCSILSNNFLSSVSGVLFSFESGMIVFLWLMVNLFTAMLLDEKAGVSTYISSLLLLFQAVSCISAYLMYNSSAMTSWSSSLFGCDNLVEAVYSIYNSIVGMSVLFYYRWDNYIIRLYSGYGATSLSLHNQYTLNLTMSSLLLFLTWWFILYNY